MKRLLTYLGLLATLLAMPYHAKADTWAYYLYGEINADENGNWNANNAKTDTYKFGDTSNSSDNITWTKTFTGAQLDPDGNHITLFKVLCVKNGNTDIQLGPLNSDQDLEVNGGAITMNKDAKFKSYKVTGIKSTAEYVIKYVSSSREGGTISIIGPATANENLKLGGDFEGWNGKKYDDFSEDGIYTWNFKTTEFPNGTKFKLCDKGTNTWYSNGAVVTEDWSSEFSGGGQMGYEMSVSYTDNDLIKISVQAMKSGNGWKIRIVKTKEPHDYYWVSPQITNNQMWPAFKMVASRNRYWSGTEVIGDGLISAKYYTFTIKDDDLVTWKTKTKIKDDTPIQWYILRDDGKVVYRPKDDLDAGYTPNYNKEYDKDHPISGKLDNYVSYINYWNGSGYGGDGAYMTTGDTHNAGSWKFLKSSAKAHTFNLNAEKGHVLYNYTTAGASDANGYKLAGNWSAGRKVSIDIKDAIEMTANYYYNHDDESKCDSIVYKVNVDRPTAGWGGLYLDVLPASSTNWNDAIRPLITLGNNLDGRALHGAMTTASSDQSLNPEASPNYLGYTFSFNATTMTYRLEFHTPDATLKPGTEDGNVDFKGSVSEDIAVALTDGSDGIHTAATQYAIGFGADANCDLSENMYTDTKFNLSFNGNTITYTSADNKYAGTVSGNSIYVKVRGFDSTGQNYGDIHTYKYTFHSKIGFEPHGGLFINSAKIRISGGVPPYKYEIWHYSPKEENGETVIDYTTGTLRSSGKFSNTAYNADDDNFRISTPGFLKIIDANNDYVSFEEVGGGFDFTYSTSENYKRNTTGAAITDVDPNNAGAYPNGADYWLAAPGDLTRLLSPTWNKTRDNGTNIGEWNYTSGSHWSGDNTVQYLHIFNNTAYQTVSNLDAGTYTVQAIVRGRAVPVYLDLNDANVASLNLTGDGENAMSAINPFGRCEQLEQMQTTTTTRGWQKLEGKATVSAGGSLKIAIRTDPNGSIDLADVILLKNANTTSGFRTTASTSPDDTKCYDFRRRQVSGEQYKQNNAYSFFDRGKNQNAVIFANNKTVIAMDPANLADDDQNTTLRNQDRRHPFNVVGTTEQDAGTGVAKALYLTDAGYDESDANCLPIGYVNSSKGNNSDAYRTHGYSFCPGLAFYAEDLIFDRDMSQMAVKKTTCMLPIAITPAQLKEYYGRDLKVYKWTSRSGNDLTFEQQKDENVLHANEPYIFWNAEGTFDSRNGKTAGKTDGKFYIGGITSTNHNGASSHSGFPGTYAYMKVQRYGDASGVGTNNINQAEETRFIYSAANGVFSVVSPKGANLKPFRAYFVIGVTDKAKEARQLNIFFDDSIITGIDSVETTAPTSGDIYTIGGVLVAKDGNMSGLPKGIYIMNGKKFVVK